MKGNEHKKLTYEDKFSRHFACWVKNNRKAWMWFKKQNRRKYRRMLKRREVMPNESRPLVSNGHSRTNATKPG